MVKRLDVLFDEGIQYLEEGKVLLNEDILLKSKLIFEKLIEKEPDNYLYHYYLGNVFVKLVNMYDILKKDKGKIKKYINLAIKELEKSIKLNDKYSDSHRLLAVAYGQKIIHEDIHTGMKYEGKVGKEYEIAISLDPKNSNAYLGSGIRYLRTPQMFGGSVERAIEEINKAISLEPNLVEAYIWLGIAYKEKDDIEKAREKLKKALKLCPKSKHAKLVLEEIKQRKNSKNILTRN